MKANKYQMILEVIYIWFLISEAETVTQKNTLHRDHVLDPDHVEPDPGAGADGDGAGLCEPHRQGGGRGPAQV